MRVIARFSFVSAFRLFFLKKIKQNPNINVNKSNFELRLLNLAYSYTPSF
jgi:hypothetical protein